MREVRSMGGSEVKVNLTEGHSFEEKVWKKFMVLLTIKVHAKHAIRWEYRATFRVKFFVIHS